MEQAIPARESLTKTQAFPRKRRMLNSHAFPSGKLFQWSWQARLHLAFLRRFRILQVERLDEPEMA